MKSKRNCKACSRLSSRKRWSDKTGNRLKDKVTVFNPGSRQQVAERLEAKGVMDGTHAYGQTDGR